MRAEQIATLTGPDLRAIALALENAALDGRRVRFVVDGGLKIAVGGECWTLPYGSVPEPA